MHPRWMAAALAALGVASLAGCHDAELDDRLVRLEARVGVLEAAATRTTAAAPQAVSADVTALEHRLAALEQRVAANEKQGAAAATPGGVAEGRLEERRERRTKLREVTDQYRARLAEIRQNPGDPAARQQAIRDALEWYREQRQAVLNGAEPAAAPTQ